MSPVLFMQRTPTLFAIVGAALLIIGLLMPSIAPSQAITVTSPRSTVGYSPRVPCYGLAALFAVFAFLYSVWTIPFSRTLIRWHFWLTFSSVLLAAAGFLVLHIVAEKNLASGRPFGPIGSAVTPFFAASIPIFLGAQLWFVIDLIRGLIKIRQG
jgi:hypothetical protein